MTRSRVSLLAIAAAAAAFLAAYVALNDDANRPLGSPLDNGEGVQNVRRQEPHTNVDHLAEPAERARAVAETNPIDRQVELPPASSQAPEDSVEADRLELSRLHVQQAALMKDELDRVLRNRERLIPAEDFNERPQSNESVVYVSVRNSGARYYSPIMRRHAPELFEVRDRIREIELNPANREWLALERILKEEELISGASGK